MRADAVTAVLAGARSVFSRAKRRGAPASNPAGRPSSDASGFTRRDDTSATPTKSARQPVADRSSTIVTVRPGANRPAPSSPRPSATMLAAMYGAYGASGDLGSVAPSRTAEIGGTDVARAAGTSAATSVIRTPTSKETTTVRAASTVPACGTAEPSAAKSAFSPLARPRPAINPTAEPSAPITNASS